MSDTLRVLLVEDNPGDADLICELVPEEEDMSFHFEVATRLSEALARLSGGGFDLVLLDLGLPDSTGLTTLRAIKAQAPRIPVVVLTGNDDAQTGFSAVQGGAQDYLIKGQISAQWFPRVLRYAVERQRAEDEIITSEERLRVVFDTSPNCLFLKDPEGRYVLVNQAIADLYEMPKEEMLGRTDEELLGPRHEEACQFRQDDRRVIETGQKITVPEERFRTSEGAVKWFRTVKTPLTLGDESRNVLGIAVDITEVKEAERKYRLLADNTIDCIWLMTPDLTFTYINPAVEKVFGYTVKEWLGTSLRDHCSPVHFAEITQVIEASLRRLPDVSNVVFECEMIHRDGKPIPVEVVGKILLDNAGNFVAVQGTTRDITERRQAERGIQRAMLDTQAREQQIAMLLQSAEAVMESRSFGEAARRVFDACREATGAASGYVALVSDDGGENEVVFLESGGLPCDVDPDLPMPIRGLRAEAYRTGAAVYENEFTNSGWMQFMPEGHVALQNVLFAPLRIEKEVVGLLGLANKATGFDDDDARLATAFGQQAAIALRNARDRDAIAASEAKYRNYVNASPLAIFIINEHGQYVDVNEAACSLLGYARDDLLGLKLTDVITDDPAKPAAQEFEALKRAGRLNTEQVLKRRDGSSVHVSLEASGLGRNQYIAYCSDITARRSLEEQLRQSQKMEAVGRLAGGVAHDFNNILQTMIGYGQFLSDRLEGEPELREFAHEILNGTHRAAALTRQLLAFSRRQVLELEDLSLNEVIESLLKMLGRVIGEHIQLDFVPGHRLGTVHADRGQMEQVLLNLTVNARDAMPDGGNLTIETEKVTLDTAYCDTHSWAKPGRYVLLSVTDTGSGMDAETLGRVFEPFFTTKRPGEGTGLGLATVHGIVSQHSGMIHAYSEPELGTTFKIYMPVVSRPASVVGTKVLKRPCGGTETILLVEDDENVGKLTMRVLEYAGYTVLTAANGEEGISVFRENAARIDLVLTDVVMPKLGGRALYDSLQKDYPHVRFLFSSGYSTNAIHTNFILEKGIDFIPKPYAPDALLRKIREVLDEEAEGQES